MSKEIADEVTGPLRTVQDLRTKLGAHSGCSEAASLRADLMRKHKTRRAHIEHLCGELLQSLNHLRRLVEPSI
jgi:bacterioferritin-associated ferredoxin